MAKTDSLPLRFQRPKILQLLTTFIVVWVVVSSFQGTGISLTQFIEGIPEMGEVLSEMFPPDLGRISRVGELLITTFQMALAGTLIGLFISLPLSAFAARNITPYRLCYFIARTITSLFRTIPDLVWALFFVVTVGIGNFAGVLTIAVDTIGFAGRFFAETIEETDKGPQEALTALGAGRLGIFCSYILPASLPGFVNTALFSLEKAVRSSVVLGLVGAGGIGVELKVSMDTFRYAEAATIIIAIFFLVILVEQVSSAIRSRLLAQK